MNEKRKKTRTETVRRAHDELKKHPYWLNFDKHLLKDVLRLFSEISLNYWGTADETNPYYAVTRCVTHDFNGMIWSVRYSLDDGRFDNVWKDRMGDVIMVMQTYLMNIHRMLDNRPPEGNVVGYTYSLNKGLEKVQAFPDPDKEGSYTVYAIVGEDMVPSIREYLNKYAGLNHESSMKTWAVGCLKELDEGREVIGKTWKIVK